MLKRFLPIIFYLVFGLTFLHRLAVVADNNLPITMDQGRDLLDIRSIAVGHKLRLIGPTTSINGVYLGPFWYYFNLPAFVGSGGHPASLTYWQIIWYQVIGLLLFVFLKKENPSLAFFVAVLFLIMPLGFNISRYSWNANAMPIFTALFLLVLFISRKNLRPRRLFFLGLTAGLALQIEAAFGIIFFPFSVLYLLHLTRKTKPHFWHTLGFIITLLPQVVFELRHQFISTKTLLSEFGGESALLGQKLNLAERFFDRRERFYGLIHDISHLPSNYLYPLFFLGLLLLGFFLFRKKVTRPLLDFFVTNVAFLAFAFIFYAFFPLPLKNWYLLGLSVPLVFIYAACLTEFFSGGLLGRTIVSLLILATFFFTSTAQAEYLMKVRTIPSDDPSNLANQLTVLDWVYRRADGQAFFAYNYVPSIYDYSWNYLYWWYGAKKYAYQPAEVAYLPGKPAYIENNRFYLNRAKPAGPDAPIFLIIEVDRENPDRQLAWRGDFSKYCPAEKIAFPFGLIAEKLITCPK